VTKNKAVEGEKQKKVSNKDLVKVILQILGQRSQDDLSFVTNTNAEQYIKDLELSISEQRDLPKSKLNHIKS